jgi:hypothetical protein
MPGMKPPAQDGTTTVVRTAPGFEAPALAGAAHKKTIMGVARPGIAPLRPGIAKADVSTPPPVPEVPPAPPAAWQPPLPPPAAVYDPLPTSSSRRPHRIPWMAALVIVAAAGLLTAAGVVFFLYRARGAIEAGLASDAEGRERLELVCRGCKDGTKVSLGGASAVFRGGRAALPIERRLPIGHNRLEVDIERSPGRSDKVELDVPVEYRVRAETAALGEADPRVQVRVQALAGTAVVVDGKPLVLDGEGNASGDVSVAKELTGAEAGVRTLERRIPYVITPPGGAPAAGEVSVRIGIVPLLVTAPGPSIVIDTPTFVLSGKTAKNATLTVEGRPITVDANGGFAQIMSVSAPGETNVVVRANAPEHAPRLVPLRVRRVDSLAAEAAAARARATTAYSAIAENPEQKRGVAVALDGTVVDARTENFTTTLIVDVTSGCAKAPCLARASFGGKQALAAGDPIGVFGVVAGAVDGPQSGTRIPSITADFLLKGRP